MVGVKVLILECVVACCCMLYVCIETIYEASVCIVESALPRVCCMGRDIGK